MSTPRPLQPPGTALLRIEWRRGDNLDQITQAFPPTMPEEVRDTIVAGLAHVLAAEQAAGTIDATTWSVTPPAA